MKDFKKYKDAYEKRRTEEEKRLKVKARRAGRAAEKVAGMLAGAYGVEKVVLFGSVIEGRFGEASDIDLGVEGLEKGSYIKALVEAESLAGFPVDIKPLEDVRESFRERIEKTGKVLYER
jgi:predicted nucleotidyltransferase